MSPGSKIAAIPLGIARPKPSMFVQPRTLIMNLFLLLKARLNLVAQQRFNSEIDPRLSAKRRMAWSVASPWIFLVERGRCCVAASNSPALQRPAMLRSWSKALLPWLGSSARFATMASRARSASMVWRPTAQSVTTILFSVNVPVLSEQMTETVPSVSTVLSDLQSTLFFFIILAAIVSEAVVATGRPSGMKATATETQEMMRLGTLIQSG